MLKVAFLWHMHQPYYQDGANGRMLLPWVRLHCLKDYYDLPARIGRHDRLRMTFNLVPSLIEQINLYVDRRTIDRHLELTIKPAADLTRPEKVEIFRTFFAANPTTMIEPYPRFRRLYKKLADCGMDAELAARTTSATELRDLTVWSNLAWIDPIFRNEHPFDMLFDKGENYTEGDKALLVEAQYKIMSETIPLYKKLRDEGKIEVSFTPYFHPILPLLCDTDVAREALPGITLPQNRFCHPEDAERQVSMAIQLYEELFGEKPVGMWPSEGSISEQAAAIMAAQGIRWIASDEEVLLSSLIKAGQPSDKASPHAHYRYQSSAGPISLFFRDHALSDRIGFVYSGWEPERAVEDFIGYLHQLEKLLEDNRDAVVPIILDGENCWEYFKDDGNKFLDLFFEALARDEKIETVTMRDAAAKAAAVELPAIQAGSWINHNFRIWIGHPEDNSAWDLLWQARNALGKFKDEHPDYDPRKIAAAEKALLIAEGSDWNWWYGDEHRGPQNEVFDRIYRSHVTAIYTNLGLEVPRALLSPIASGLPESYSTEPDGLITPTIDGRLTHYYEWMGSGKFDCEKAGGAMHRSDHVIKNIYYASDDVNVYLRVDFESKSFLVNNQDKYLEMEILNPGKGKFIFSGREIVSIPDWAGDKKAILFGCNELVEVGIPKTIFFPEGRGEIFFRIAITRKGETVETWPEGDPIRFSFSGRGEEIVWDL